MATYLLYWLGCYPFHQFWYRSGKFYVTSTVDTKLNTSCTHHTFPTGRIRILDVGFFHRYVNYSSIKHTLLKMHCYQLKHMNVCATYWQPVFGILEQTICWYFVVLFSVNSVSSGFSTVKFIRYIFGPNSVCVANVALKTLPLKSVCDLQCD
jgi:hypothetical protein